LLPGAVVFGYLPYWITDTSQLRLDLLSHVAWFAVEMSSTGTATNTHGWPDTAFVQQAHAAGVKVVLVFTLFSSTGIATLVNSRTNRATAIQTAITQMKAGGADGINIDFEGAPANARDGLTAFFCELREALTAAGAPDAEISIAGPAVDWSNAWNLPAILGCGVNHFFIMGYDFYGGWSGSGVGPSGLLRVTPLWRPTASWSEQRSMATWANQVGAAHRKNIILGVPYYGNQWRTSSAEPGAANLGHDGSRTYVAVRQALASGIAPRLWEAGSETPWYTFVQDGVRRQVWYDDEESLKAKYRMAKEQGLGGVGMWALGYDNGYDELWNLIAEEFTHEDPKLEGTRELPLRIVSFPFHDERDTSSATQAPSNYFNFYSCAPSTPEYGREVVYRLDLCQPGTLKATVADGTGVDIDIHLLNGLGEKDCLTRNDTEITHAVQPGTYYLVADTYISDFIEQKGPFTLDVAFTPTGGEPCAPDEVCIAGTCTKPQADAGVLDGETPDTGPATDGGANAQADAATDASSGESADGGSDSLGGGCACWAAPSHAPSATVAWTLGLPVLLALRRRLRK